MYSDLRRVPVRFKTNVFGWTNGCTGSASNFFDGGYVTNLMIIVLLMPFNWMIWRGTWRYRWRRVQLLFILILVFFYRGCRRGRHYRTIVPRCPRRRTDRSTIPRCFYFILNYRISTLVWHFVILRILLPVSSFAWWGRILTLGVDLWRGFLLFSVGCIREEKFMCFGGSSE